MLIILLQDARNYTLISFNSLGVPIAEGIVEDARHTRIGIS